MGVRGGGLQGHVGGGLSWGKLTEREQDQALAVYCAGRIDLPESQRETKYVGT